MFSEECHTKVKNKILKPNELREKRVRGWKRDAVTADGPPPSLCAPLLLGCRPGRRSVGAGSAERRGRGRAEAEPVCPGPRLGGGAGPRGRAGFGFHPGGAFWFLCRNGTVWGQLLGPNGVC